MARLPIPGSDDGTWGDILNTYLQVSLDSEGAINDGVVGTDQIANDAVTNAKIADNAVDTSQIATDAVDNAKIADDAVDTAQIADGAITNTQVDASASISADKLADGTTNKIFTATERTKLSGISDGATDLTITDQGAWTTSTNYSAGDVVTYQYARWMRKTDGSGGVSFTASEWIHLGLYAVGTTSDPGGGMLWVDVS